jgi:hypothetical protein
MDEHQGMYDSRREKVANLWLTDVSALCLNSDSCSWQPVAVAGHQYFLGGGDIMTAKAISRAQVYRHTVPGNVQA